MFRLSRTLFWYIFWDLLKVFALASCALAGIMSFGGLLRPLTQNGLDGGQVAAILGYLMPAMSTYSLPVAALFATTVVYGRLSAENEIIACRASGIDFLSLTIPGVILGLFVSIFSIFFLSYVVPKSLLGVERVVSSNLAQIIVAKIDRSHQFDLGSANPYVVYAQSARIPEESLKRTDRQEVVLTGPMIVQFETQDIDGRKTRVPRDFWIAKQATLTITPDKGGSVFNIEASLESGMTFPRRFSDRGYQAGIDETVFTAPPMESGVREHTKFMSTTQLQRLNSDPRESRKVRNLLDELIRQEQISRFIDRCVDEMRERNQKFSLRTSEGYYEFSSPLNATRKVDDGLILSPPQGMARMEEQVGGKTVTAASAKEIRVIFRIDPDGTHFIATAKMLEASLDIGETSVSRASFQRTFNIAIPDDLLKLKDKDVLSFLSDKSHPEKLRNRLRMTLAQLGNYAQSEMHARASFSVSCLILVLVGCSLGMMFRSGNFVNAFAVSVIPALCTTLLIVSGQHIAENIPQNVTSFDNPALRTGLVVIWAGNVIAAALAGVLLYRLQRQ